MKRYLGEQMRENSTAIARNFWAAHLGISPEQLFAEPLRVIRHAGGLREYGGVFALFQRGAKVVSLPPEQADRLRPVVLDLPADFLPKDLELALRPFAAAVLGPVFIGYADRVPAPAHCARMLTPEDAPAVAALEAACTDREWEHGGCNPGEHSASGVFAGAELVALAGFAIWGETIAQISVVTHPAHRGRGFGTAAVSHLAARALASGLLPQYRTLASNQPSMRLAKAIGFVRYATSLAVRLED